MAFPVPEPFREALCHSHRMVSEVNLFTLENEPIEGYQNLPITDGNFRFDDSEFRTQLDFQMQDEDGRFASPEWGAAPIEPAYTIAQARRGLYLPGDDFPTWVNLGKCIVESFRVDDGGEGVTVTVDCIDYGKKLDADKFTDDTAVADGISLELALWFLIVWRLQSWQQFFYLGDASLTVSGRACQTGDSRWTHAQSIAKSAGCELYFDEELNLICAPIPEVGEPVTNYTEGPDCKMLYLAKSRQAEGVVNTVVVSGESAHVTTGQEIPRGVAEDRNPNSPTNVDRYGPRVHHTNNGNVRTDHHARVMAQGLLRKLSGRPERLELTNIVDPSLRLGDTIKVERERVGLNSLQIIDKLTIPLTPTRAMNISTRERLLQQ